MTLPSNKVFSYQEKKNLLDVSRQISDYVKKEYNVRMLKEIKVNHIQAWLNDKAESCNQTTIKQYISRIRKLEVLANQRFQMNVKWSDEIKEPLSQKINQHSRTQVMDKNDLAKIVEYSYTTNSKCSVALDFAARTGLRTVSLERLKVVDINLKTERIHYVGKGGRHGLIPIKPEDIPFLRSLIENREPNEKLFGVTKKAIQKQMQRCKKALGLSEKYKLTGIHSVRKRWAQDLWDKCRDEGKTPQEAMKIVSEALGHGANRKDVINRYVANQH